MEHIEDWLALMLVLLSNRQYPFTVLTEEQSLFWTYYTILSYPSVWISLLFTSIVAIIPDIVLKVNENFEQTRRASKTKAMTSSFRVSVEDKTTRERLLNDVPKKFRLQQQKKRCKKQTVFYFNNQQKYFNMFIWFVCRFEAYTIMRCFEQKSYKKKHLENQNVIF